MKNLVLFSSDIHKSYASMRLLGVFTSIEKLRESIKTLLEKDEISLDGGYSIDDVDVMGVDLLQNHIEYAYIEEVEVNTLA